MLKQQKEVVEKNKRKYIKRIATIWFRGKNAMPKQAKTLTQQELRRVLDYITTRKHAPRNKAMVMTTFLSGVRVGELASLRYCDVVDGDGKIRNEIRLTAEQTKGKEARVVYVNQRLCKELTNYIKTYCPKDKTRKLFYSQKEASNGFSANSLSQFFHYLYQRCGISGASSHSGRRTFITTLANKGISVRVLASLAGHKNISTTQCYIDVNDEMKREAVELV